VRKIEFPRAAVPLSVVLTASFNLLLNLVPVLIFLLAAGAGVRWSWLEVPFLLVGLALFACGVAMLLSALFVRYRDMDPIWDVVLQVMFYLSPIFYPIELVISKTKVPDWVPKAMLVNPFAAILQQGRRALFGPSYDSVWKVMGGPLALVPLGIAVFVVVYGTWYFNRQAPRIAEEL
jgi:ABC-2 type transport system permease protein